MVAGSRYFDATYTFPWAFPDPVLYVSDYAPVPFNYCNSSFTQCRTYTSFINRRYYMIAQWGGSTGSIRLQGNTNFPPSDDNLASYYSQYWGVSYYPEIRTVFNRASSRDSSIISPTNPGSSISATIYGSTLAGLPSGYLFSINLNGRTLFSNQRNFGEYQGSFIRLILSGFTSLFGCGATISNRLSSISAPLYC